jgi:hypothetical protein
MAIVDHDNKIQETIESVCDQATPYYHDKDYIQRQEDQQNKVKRMMDAILKEFDIPLDSMVLSMDLRMLVNEPPELNIKMVPKYMELAHELRIPKTCENGTYKPF